LKIALGLLMKVPSHHKRLLLMLCAVVLLAAIVLRATTSHRQTHAALSSSAVISQIYGGGGNSGATLKNDFIELFNAGNSSVDVSTWSIQYAAATGTSWQVTNLCASGTCTIAPGHYYLIQEAQGAAGSTDLPSPDATGVIAMSATGGKVALVNNTTALSGSCPIGSSVIDLIGYGSANCFEGSAATNAPSNTTAELRINSGCTDTDKNDSDFVTGAPNPRNSSSPAITCGVSPSPSPTPSSTPTPNCGVERWSVKTGTDPDASAINFVTQPTTIATMRSWTPPSPIPPNNRVAPFETAVWTVNANLLEYKFEDDSDYHIVLQDEAGNTIIGEIPSPGCVGSGSPFAVSIANARMKFNAMFTASTSFQFANVPVQVTGVGMFDFLHGQTGVAPNGIELHPILDINFTSPTPAVQFSASSYSINEGGGDAVVTVTRAGNTAGTSTVDYATSDTSGANNCNVANGNASSRCDYLTTLGTIRFAAGQSNATIQVPIIDDGYAEGPETFVIALSSPSGASLGAPASATVTITDNETANGVNPIDGPAFFVRQHYLDFLNREPDSPGFLFWKNEIVGCGADQQCTETKRINVSASFFLSIEFQETGYLVERIYKTSFGDATGTSIISSSHQLAVPMVRLNEFLHDTQEIGQGVVVGQGNWQQQLETNKQAFSAEFAQRARFTGAFPSSLTPAAFVDRLFTNTGITPTSSERSDAIGEFGSATNIADAAARGRALRRVAENPGFNQQEFNRAFVLMQFFGYLRRNPDDPQDHDYSGYDFWLTKLNQFNGNYINAEMVKAFMSSGEYRQRFGP
jgi:hypothetical protein